MSAIQQEIRFCRPSWEELHVKSAVLSLFRLRIETGDDGQCMQ